MTDSDCEPDCNCTLNACICYKGDGFGDGHYPADGEPGDGDGDGKTAAIVGGTVGSLVGLAGLAGIIGLMALGAGLLFRYFQGGQGPPTDIASALDNGNVGDHNVNPLHEPQVQSTLNPLFQDI